MITYLLDFVPRSKEYVIKECSNGTTFIEFQGLNFYESLQIVLGHICHHFSNILFLSVNLEPVSGFIIFVPTAIHNLLIMLA